MTDPTLTRFRDAVDKLYGDRIERVVLYGSRARGDEKPDSDYAIAVFIKGAGTFTGESARLAATSTDILVDAGAVICATPFLAKAPSALATTAHFIDTIVHLLQPGADLLRGRPA